MTEADNIARRLSECADAIDMGRKPDPKSIHRRAAAELRRLSAIEVELELTRQTHLSVVQRLQAEIDKLKRELEKEAQYSASLRNEADERAEADARAYNCGEL